MRKYIFIGFSVFLLACNNSPKGDKAIINDVKSKQKIAKPNVKSNSSDIYKISKEDSKVYWTGSKPTRQHHGVLDFKTGEIWVKNGSIVGGIIIFDMNSIKDESLTGAYKSKLEKHLKSPDFFDVKLYPEARFEILEIIKVPKNKLNNNYKVVGKLRIKNVEKQIEFNALIDFNENEIIVNAPQFTFDRTLFNINYKSKKFFPSLKDKFIDDIIGVSFKLIAKK